MLISPPRSAGCDGSHTPSSLCRVRRSSYPLLAVQGEVAHECVLLKAMRPGYRTISLRDKKGTLIDLCCLLLYVDLGEAERPMEEVASVSDEGDDQIHHGNLAVWRATRQGMVGKVKPSELRQMGAAMSAHLHNERVAFMGCAAFANLACRQVSHPEHSKSQAHSHLTSTSHSRSHSLSRSRSQPHSCSRSYIHTLTPPHSPSPPASPLPAPPLPPKLSHVHPQPSLVTLTYHPSPSPLTPHRCAGMWRTRVPSLTHLVCSTSRP